MKHLTIIGIQTAGQILCKNYDEKLSELRALIIRKFNWKRTNKGYGRRMCMKERKLKVYQTYSNTYRPIPQIMLKGQWLKDIGFDIGTNIEVQLIENMLVIKQIIIEEKEAVKIKRKKN